MKDSRDTEIVPELMPQSGDIVLDKNKASMFYKTWLDLYLRYFGIKTLLIAGCITGYCVLHTVYDAWARDLDVIVIEDGVSDPDPFIHETLLEQIDRRFGRVLKWEFVERALMMYPECLRIEGPEAGAGRGGSAVDRVSEKIW